MFGGLVRTHGFDGDGEIHLPIQDRPDFGGR
jgi:hypothetical protein